MLQNFDHLEFSKTDDDRMRVVLHKFFYSDIALNDSDVQVDIKGRSSLEIPKKHIKRFYSVLNRGLQNLTSIITNKPAIYVHAGSGIPLLGSQEFGIIDRGTNVVELRPLSGCNVGCVFCSVDDSRRVQEFIVEPDYILEQLELLLPLKACDNIELVINPQGEAGYYAPLVELVHGAAKIPCVKDIALYTTGAGITVQKLKELANAGLSKISFSLHTLESGHNVASSVYRPDHITDLARLSVSLGLSVILAPVYVKGLTDGYIEDICRFAIGLRKKASKDSQVQVLVQNFLVHKLGKKPAGQVAWPEFFKFLDKLKTAGLLTDVPAPSIVPAKPLPIVIERGQRARCRVICRGRLRGQWLAVCNDRSVSVKGPTKPGYAVVRITKNKDNLYYGSA